MFCKKSLQNSLISLVRTKHCSLLVLLAACMVLSACKGGGPGVTEGSDTSASSGGTGNSGAGTGGGNGTTGSSNTDVVITQQNLKTATPSIDLSSWNQIINVTEFWGKKVQVNLAQFNSLLQIVPTQYQIIGSTWNGLRSLIPNNSSVSNSGNFSWSQIVPGNFGRHEFRIRATSASGQTQDLILPVQVDLPDNTPRLCEQTQRAFCQFLNSRWASGQAAGNLEEFYNNKDNGHSLYPVAQYSRQLKSFQWGHYANGAPHRKTAVVGNESTFPGVSNARFGMNRQSGFDYLQAELKANRIYWYPAHTDFHGPAEYYHFNGLYNNSTKGSSGSDLQDTERTLVAWAAFRPDVKMKLMEEGLLAAATQYFLRRSRVDSDSQYLTGAAHASVIFNIESSQNETRLRDMAQAVNSMTMENLLPFAQMSVVAEDWSAAENEHIGTTPWGIHRVWRNNAYQKTVVLSAENSFDLNGRPLTFQWVALRGNHAVQIEPLNPSGSRARITFTYHGMYEWSPLQPGSHTGRTWRVDIGLFANNGVAVSAPAMFTSHTLMSEDRTYSQSGQLLSITPGYYGDSEIMR